MSNKIYAVKVGRIPGKYYTWADCEKQVKGFKGQEFKSFSGESADVEADVYLGILNESSVIVKKAQAKKEDRFFERVEPLENNIYGCTEDSCLAYVDGSYDKASRYYGSGVVLFTEDKKYLVHGCDNKEYLSVMNNISGELLAAILAVRLAKFLGKKKILIIHDLEGTGSWIRDPKPNATKLHWDRNKRGTIEYGEFIDNQFMNIEFKWVKGHSGVEGNEESDKLASSAIKQQILVDSERLFYDLEYRVDFFK